MPLFSKKIVPTEITNNIEEAADPNVTELDWSLVIKICELVNSTELGAKEARKLLQKKMVSNDPKVQVLALEILNCLAENSTDKFRPQLAAKSFGEDLYSLASSKDKDDRVHGKLAQCLETWESQTKGDPAFGNIHRAYGIMTNGPDTATNQRRGVHNSTRREPNQHRQPSEAPAPRGPATLEEMKRDIELAQNSAQLFSQTLSFTDPTEEDISKNELIQEFHSKCKQMQQLLSGHLVDCSDSDVISALINANNELLSCFKSYDEMLEQRATNEATVNSQTLHNRNTREDEQLIDSDGPAKEPASSSSNPYHYYQQDQQDKYQQFQQERDQLPSSAALEQNLPSSAQINSQNPSNDLFDPFSDTNHIQFPTNQQQNATATSPENISYPSLTPKKVYE